MQKTNNIGLNKPDKEDFYDVSLLNENADIIDEKIKEIEDGIGGTANHIENENNPHKVTKEQVGLGNVPNVTTNDQIVTYTEASKLTALTNGEKISIAIGKIAKTVSTVISHISTKATSSIFGHVKLLDTYKTKIDGATAANGVGVSQNALYNAYNEINNSLTANSKQFYFDYKDGKYGFNTSSNRGADTFTPFSKFPCKAILFSHWFNYAFSYYIDDTGYFDMSTVGIKSEYLDITHVPSQNALILKVLKSCHIDMYYCAGNSFDSNWAHIEKDVSANDVILNQTGGWNVFCIVN